MSGRGYLPTGATGPLHRRLSGAHLLLVDVTIKVRSLHAVGSDCLDGILTPYGDDREVLRMVLMALESEARALDQISDRLRELAQELAREGTRR